MEREQSGDLFFMRAAMEQARKALSKGEVPIGAVMVCDGRIVARGHNMVETLHDATAHAEMQVITSAAAATDGKYLGECTLYVTVEPCPMCASASSWAQVGRIVYGAPDPKRGYSTVGEKLLHPKTTVEGGIMKEECAGMMEDFFKKLR